MDMLYMSIHFMIVTVLEGEGQSITVKSVTGGMSYHSTDFSGTSGTVSAVVVFPFTIVTLVRAVFIFYPFYGSVHAEVILLDIKFQLLTN